MSEAKDPAIKLFGKTIPVAEAPVSSGAGSPGASGSACATSVDDNMDQDPTSLTNTIKDEEDGEEEKVSEFFIFFWINFFAFFNFRNWPIILKPEMNNGLVFVWAFRALFDFFGIVAWFLFLGNFCYVGFWVVWFELNCQVFSFIEYFSFYWFVCYELFNGLWFDYMFYVKS